MKRVELKGMRFGLLTVLKLFDCPKSGGSRWECRCDCGEKTVVRSVHLRSGATNSCGCQQGRRTHLHSKSVKRHKQSGEYSSWRSMRARCLDQTHKLFHRYGGRGISICDSWNSFPVFLSDMGTKPDGSTIGRIDNDLGYSKGNCRWESKKSQERNKSTTRWIEHDGERKSLTEWCEIYRLPFHVVHYRLRAGWNVERALKTPKAPR